MSFPDSVLGSPLLVVVEPAPEGRGGTKASKELLSLARTLTTGEVCALYLGADPDVSELASLGADKVLSVAAGVGGFNARVPAACADAVTAALEACPDLSGVLIPSTYVGRAAGTMVATAQDLGIGIDVSGVQAQDGALVGLKSALQGSWKTSFTGDMPAIMAVRPGVGPAEGALVTPGKATSAEPLTFGLSPAAKAVQVVSSTPQAEGERIPLTDADVVVVAGRGIDGDTELVEGLADALGAGIGATRVACDEGWLPRACQIGQTGLNIAPKVYLALGVSGAIHHVSGVLASENILAIVDDPDAPILEIADFAVVGDVAEVVPQLLEKLAAAGKD